MDAFLQKCSQVYRKPWPLLIITLLATLIMATGVPKIKIDNDLTSMLPKTERTRAMTELYDSEANFGSSNTVLIGIQAPDIFSIGTLTYIKQLEDELAAFNMALPSRQMTSLLNLTTAESNRVMDGLHTVGINDFNYQEQMVDLLRSAAALQNKFGWDKVFAEKLAQKAASVTSESLFGAYSAPLGKIQSMISADYIAYEDDSLVAKKLIDNRELTPENIAGLKERVQSWDTYEGTLVSKDLSLTAISVSIKTQDKTAKALLNKELQQITSNPPASIKTFVTGEPVISDQLGAAGAKDMSLLIPIMGLVLILILFFCFRSVQGILYPILITLLSVIWSFGLMGHLGVPLTSISSTIPILLMTIVSAYGIHQINHYYEDHRTSKFDILHHNARSVGLAILLSGLTTMIGFGSMIAAKFVPIRDFGIFTAFGDMVGVLAALFILPALLMLGKPERKPRRQTLKEEKKDIVAHFLHLVKDFGKAHPGRLLIVTAILTLGLATGASLVKSDMDTVKFFPYDDPIRQADRIINEKMSGTKSLSVVLDSDTRDPLTRTGNPEKVIDLANPEVLRKVDQFSHAVKATFPNVKKVTSYADVVRKMNQVMNGGDPQYYTIPDDPALISEYMVIFSGDSKALLTSNHDKMKIIVIMNQGGIEEIHEIAAYAASYFDPAFLTSNHLQVQVAGAQAVTYMANQLLLKGNLEGIIACIVIVFLILLVVLRNLKMSLIAIIPIALGLVVNFGYLGFSGTELNTATSLVSSIGIGIGIDFSIHFITWYRRELMVDRDILMAVDRTIVHKGRAILYNWLAIVGGFLVLLGSRMGPLRDFGLLTAICLTVTAFGALIVVPAAIRLLARKNYDFLYLGVKSANPSALETE